jgi:hypothetical protein
VAVADGCQCLGLPDAAAGRLCSTLAVCKREPDVCPSTRACRCAPSAAAQRCGWGTSRACAPARWAGWVGWGAGVLVTWGAGGLVCWVLLPGCRQAAPGAAHDYCSKEQLSIAGLLQSS